MAGVILTLTIGIVWLSMHAKSDRKVSMGPFGANLPSNENLLCSHQHRAVGCAHFLE
jgi:hypothetical protein